MPPHQRLRGGSRLDISIGGAELAGQAVAEGRRTMPSISRAGLVGGGKHALPADAHAELELLDERRFRSGVVYVHYRLCRKELDQSS